MSIWSSVGGDAYAVDLHDAASDDIRAVGDENIVVDVATATSWNNRIRLAAFDRLDSPEGVHMDVCLMLSPAAAEQLHKNLGKAIEQVRAIDHQVHGASI